MTRRLSFGPAGGGLPFEQWVHNAITRIEKWSHDVLTRHDSDFLRTASTSETVTIAAGAIEASRSFMIVDTEGAAATDNLDNITGGIDGMRLMLRAADNARTVVVKDSTGNIASAGDFSLDSSWDTISFIFDAALDRWLEIGRSDNAA